MGQAIEAVGGVIGGITGTLAGKPVYSAQTPTFDRTAFDIGEQEKALTDMLVARARGEAASPAEQQMRMGLDQAQRQAAAQAAGTRGVSSALAARLAQQSQADMGTQAIGQSAVMRAQEQARAEQSANAMLADQRAARAAREELGVRAQLGTEGLRQGAAEGAATRQANLIGGAGQAAIMAAMMGSDKNMKKNIGPGDKEVKSFLDALKAEQYEYKNPSYGQGKHVSPMAQDLEKTAIGRQMVIDTPAGKLVDYGKGLGAMLAAQAHLNERLEKVEKKKMADGGLVLPDRYRGFANQIAMPQVPVVAQPAGMTDETKMGLAKLMAGSDSKPSLGAQQGTSINMTPNGWIDRVQQQGPAMMMASQGAMVPGKAKVAGDSEANDVVPALLSPGEMIIPRTVVQEGPGAVKSFAQAILMKEKQRG